MDLDRERVRRLGDAAQDDRDHVRRHRQSGDHAGPPGDELAAGDRVGGDGGDRGDVDARAGAGRQHAAAAEVLASASATITASAATSSPTEAT